MWYMKLKWRNECVLEISRPSDEYVSTYINLEQDVGQT